MGIDERPVKVNRLLVILGGFRILTQDEMKLSSVVVNVGVVLVVSDRKLKVVLGGILTAYCTAVLDRFNPS